MEYIQEFIRYLKFERRYSVHTQKAYEFDLTQFNDYLSSEYECTLLDAKDVMVRSWMMFLIEGNCSKRSLNRKLSSIKQFYKYALRNDILLTNPTLRVISLKSDKKMLFKFGEEDEEISEEMVVIDRNKSKINMGKYIYEFFILEIPAKRLHPSVINEDNIDNFVFTTKKTNDIDPRLDPLNKLK